MTADEFRTVLTALDMTQSSFARKVGISRVAVNRWANGETKVPKLAAAYIRLLCKTREGER